MKSNVTYELHSKPERDINHYSIGSDKYGKSWNSPKSKMKNTLAKIDEELLSIKEKIKTVQITPQRSLSRFSIEFICSKNNDFDMDMRYGELINEVNQKELIFKNMINDMKILENRIEEFHYSNIDLAQQLENERELRNQMDQEIQSLMLRLNGMNGLEQEIFRLKEDNIRMYEIINDRKNENNIHMILKKDSTLWREHDYVYDNNGNRTQDNTFDDNNGRINTKSTFNLTPQPKNEVCYWSEKKNDHHQSSLHTNNQIYFNKTKDNCIELSQPEQQILCPIHQHKRKSQSVDHYSEKIKHHTPEEDKKYFFGNVCTKHQYIHNQEKNEDPLITLSNLPENKELITKDSIPISSIKKKGQGIHHQTISQFSVNEDICNTNQKKPANDNKHKSKSSNKDKGTQLGTENDYEESHIDTHPHQEIENAQIPLSENQKKMVNLIERINELTETLNQTQNQLENRLKELETKEQENKILKDQIEEHKTQANDISSSITDNLKPLSPSKLIEQSIVQFTVCPNVSSGKQRIIQKDNLQYPQLNKPYCKKSNLFSKLKINTNTALDDSINKSVIKLSNNLLFKPYDKKRLLCFDLTNYKFTLIEFIDYSNYDSSFQKNGMIYLSHEDGIYIITGDNIDCLYSYTHSNKAMNKLSNLSNNHSYGGLISYQKTSTNDECLVCLSGWYNKKVEEYSTNKNEWKTLSEMQSERGESSYLVCNNEKIFAFFGYNCPQKKFMNTIEYCHINKNTEEDYKWNILKYSYQGDPFSLYIKAHSLLMINPNSFVLVGGYDGKDNSPVDNFIQANIEENKETFFSFSKVNRKLFGIDKNHLYNFNSDFSSLCNQVGTLYQVCFDEEERVHSINIDKMSHDIFYYD